MGTPRANLRFWHTIVKLHRRRDHLAFLTLASFCLASIGCAFFPETRHRESLHNPFPQLKRVAVLPFFNQSSEPTVNGEQVAESYYAALQAIPGFEVLPVGVTKAQWLRYSLVHGEPRSGEEFQRLAREMGVEAIVVGSVTDFDPYYPPRMGMTVHWYAANEGFHGIPAGYGLPWGTDAEKQIPRRITREAEFELARSQLATQSPITGVELAETMPQNPVSQDPVPQNPVPQNPVQTEPSEASQPPTPPRFDASQDELLPEPQSPTHVVQGHVEGDWVGEPFEFHASDELLTITESPLPMDWPDPTDLIPDPPSPQRPLAITNHEPVLSQTRLYRGDDSYFTSRLADYVETNDDARPGGWQDYLKRSDDFIRFCCHLHVTEMLESRGGRDQSDLILRWPLSRY